MIDDPRLIRLQRALTLHAPRRALRTAGDREAAVALLIRPRDALEVLLIKRSEREADPWSGHMALPGGGRAPEDEDLRATAMRETAEEVGIDTSRVGTVIGELDDVAPKSPRLPPVIIAPFVIAVPPHASATPDPREVEAALWIPLAALRDESAVAELVLELEGGTRTFPSLRYNEHVIWGLTHRILTQFLTIAHDAGL